MKLWLILLVVGFALELGADLMFRRPLEKPVERSMWTMLFGHPDQYTPLGYRMRQVGVVCFAADLIMAILGAS